MVQPGVDIKSAFRHLKSVPVFRNFQTVIIGLTFRKRHYYKVCYTGTCKLKKARALELLQR